MQRTSTQSTVFLLATPSHHPRNGNSRARKEQPCYCSNRHEAAKILTPGEAAKARDRKRRRSRRPQLELAALLSSRGRTDQKLAA